MGLTPPPSLLELVKANPSADSQWKTWLNDLFEYISNMENDFWIQQAIREIESSYGDKVSVVKKKKSLLKYGRSEQVDNTSGGWTIMTSPTGVQAELDLYANDIDKVTSTSASDASKILTVEGHTYSSGDLTFVVQDVTLDATNPTTTAATLSTPLRNITRAYLKNSGTAGSPQSDLVGTIYFWDDNGGALTISGGVPSNTAYVHMMIRAGLNQTEKASTSISSTDYWIVTGIYASMLTKSTSASAEVTLFTRDVGNGGVWRKVVDTACSFNGTTDAYRTGYPYIIIPKNHDIKLVGYGDSVSARSVAAGIFGVLAKVV